MTKNDSMLQADSTLIKIREKYRQERDKRLRADGNDQYIKTQEGYDDFHRDPFNNVEQRESVNKKVEVLVVGAGFAGLMAAVRLKQAGFNDMCIIERGGDFGGTWYWNRYPGAQCDIESYIYLPLLEELGYMPKKKYSNASEIFSHTQAIGRHYQLYDDALFHTLVTELRWLEDIARWSIVTDRGDKILARFICMADGPLNQPKLPGIKGIDRFQNKMFHSSRWDYAYTGGDAKNTQLDKLADQRVGIIGTGASSIQCIPYLASYARQLYVFQRTPSSVMERNNMDTEKVWATKLEPGWQLKRMENFNRVVSGIDHETDLVNDGLSQIMRKLSQLPGHNHADEYSAEQLALWSEQKDLQQMERVRAHVDQVVTDPETAAALKPWYRLFCKRPCFNDDYLKAFNRANVKLVDTQGKGVSHLTEKEVIVGEQAYEVDCLIFSTGFEVGTSYPKRSGFELIGKNGLTLTENWADGMRTLHGLQSRSFPNCFFLGMTQGGYTANYTHMLYQQSAHIAYILDSVKRQNMNVVEVTEQGESQWLELINSFATGNLNYFKDCTPGYYNNEGKPGEGRAAKIVSFYGGGSEAFFQILQEWRDQGAMAGLNLSRGEA